MQSIDRPGRYIAEWAGFRIILDKRMSHCTAQIRRRDGDVIVATLPELPELPRRTAAEAIEWAAQQLGQLGATAMVDGARHSLADFLVFSTVQ